MKLYRNISTNELYRLFVDGKVEGKLFPENKDSTYKQETHGEIIFFFDTPVWLSYFDGYTIMLEIETDEESISGNGYSRYSQAVTHYEDNPYMMVVWRNELYLRNYSSTQVTKIWTQMEELEQAILDDIRENDCLFLFNSCTSERHLADLSLEEMRSEFEKISNSDIDLFLQEVNGYIKESEIKEFMYAFRFVKDHFNVIEMAEKDDYDLPTVMSDDGAVKSEIVEYWKVDEVNA